MHTPDPIFCRICHYSLRGLNKGCCPECGQPFDPDDRHTYATSPARADWRRLGRAALCFCIFVGVLCVIEFGVEQGQAVQSCNLCGVRSVVQHFRLFGLGGEYDRTVIEGVVSEFIQAQTGMICGHTWDTHSWIYGGILRQGRACRPGGRLSLTAMIDGGAVDARAVLDARAVADPDFAQRFIDAIRDPSAPGHKQFLDQTTQHIWDTIIAESQSLANGR